jgi:ParB-like chromosome segregation protein Spo0J
MTLNIQQRAVTDLIPYIANSRTHSDAQVAQIAASIKEFGWTNPILVSGDDSIIAGAWPTNGSAQARHGRSASDCPWIT